MQASTLTGLKVQGHMPAVTLFSPQLLRQPDLCPLVGTAQTVWTAQGMALRPHEAQAVWEECRSGLPSQFPILLAVRLWAGQRSSLRLSFAHL